MNNKNNADESFLNTIDVEECMKKNLINNNNYDKYLELQSFYRLILETFILNKINIKKIDYLFDNSGLHFKWVAIKEKDIYQQNSYLNSRYFYIRNNFNIERLNVDELEQLQKMYDKKETMNFEFIKGTIKKLIASSIDARPNEIQFYGLLDIKYSANNTDLVFGFRYDHFSNEEELKEEWENNYYKQIDFIKNVLPKITNELSKLLELDVKIIEYNDYSVSA